MGGGSWNVNDYTNRTSSKLSSHGTSFAYDKDAKASGRLIVHASLDPKWVAGPASPLADMKVREARDSDDHPESLPVAVLFDVTGSMGRLPMILQSKLPKLHGLLLAKGYVEHPQILFGAIGDATIDKVPLQIGQFESDNRSDENLENFILEGGGGGQTHESYQLGAYFMARHTVTDAWEKRGKRGYLFFIGDERSYKTIDRHEVERLIGEPLQENLSTEQIFEELKERWDVYFLYAEEGSYSAKEIIDPDESYKGDLGIGWRKLLGQNALILESADAVCETIALTIGLGEGSIDLDEGLAHLREEGTETKAIEATGKALAAVGAGTSSLGDASGDLDVDDQDGADRL